MNFGNYWNRNFCQPVAILSLKQQHQRTEVLLGIWMDVWYSRHIVLNSLQYWSHTFVVMRLVQNSHRPTKTATQPQPTDIEIQSNFVLCLCFKQPNEERLYVEIMYTKVKVVCVQRHHCALLQLCQVVNWMRMKATHCMKVTFVKLKRGHDNYT